MSDMELYRRYFPPGMKVGVGIPLPSSEVFKEWAIIHDIDEDLVSLQLSRDVLPVEVSLHYGQILELRGGNEHNGYCCRAIVVSEGDAHELLLRLIGEIVSDELREFYRIDAFLPIKLFVSHEQKIDTLHKQWEERRAFRQQHDAEQKDTRWAPHTQLPADSGLPDRQYSNDATDVHGIGSVSHQDSGEQSEDRSWDGMIPLAANISGGGLRIITHQEFEDGEYALLEILVPSPRRIIDVVGRVVFANRNYAAGSDHEYFNTGVQFVYMDERDRDVIITYISKIQLKRIRQLRERYLYRDPSVSGVQSDPAAGAGSGRHLLWSFSALIIVVLISLLTGYFWRYVHEHPKGEIQRTFEDSVKKYRDQTNQK